ncbi:MAG: ABC transporter permease [Rhodobacteraceae bacterium]|nr:ABC transporter permease [Paracoccaceae bacterium]
MLGIVVERIGLAFFTMVFIAIVVFAGLQAMPGDACTVHLGRGASDTALASCRSRMGLDRPATTRFFEWSGNIVKGDLGVSIQRKKPIAEIVGWRLRNTLILSGVAALMGIPLAIFLGVISGLRRDGPLDVGISSLAIFGMTVPEFISGTLMIFVFSVTLGWASGVVMAGYKAPALDLVRASILPAATLTFILAAHILRMVRSSIIEVLDSEFVLMARLKGLPRRQIIWRHVVPNALLPAISVIGLTAAWLLGGVVIVESVFNYPGLGRLAVDAVADQDLPLVQAIALLFGIIYILVNLGADLLALVLNPRLRTLRG